MRIFPLVLAVALAPCLFGANEAAKLYRQGRKAEKAGQVSKAYLLYSEAAALEPSNHLYISRMTALQTEAVLASKVTPNLVETDPEIEAAPEPDEPAPPPPITPQDLAEARKPLPPTKLDAQPGQHDFDLRGDAKTLFQTVSKAYGLDCVFDGDYKPADRLRFQMDQVDYREALHAMEAVTGSFIVPISSRLFLVVKDTAQKRKEEEPFAAVTIPLPEPTTQQDLTAMITAVQQACGIQKVAWDSKTNTVLMRDSLSKVLPAQQLFKDLLYPRAQILVEMEFVQLSKTKNLNYGFPLPSAFPWNSFSTFMNNLPQVASTVTNMLRFGGGAGLIGIGVANLTLIASLTDADSELLLRATARSVDGQAATIHVGQKYPILTGTFVGTTGVNNNTGAIGSANYIPPPSFTFEDLGFSLKATPHVHGQSEVTLSIEAEFKVLAGAALNGLPIIANRQVKSDVSLKMGEWALIAGLVDDEDARSLSGIAGLAGIPLIGPLTSNVTHTSSSDHVVIMIRPVLITQPPDDSLTHVLRMGAEQRPLTPL